MTTTSNSSKKPALPRVLCCRSDWSAETRLVISAAFTRVVFTGYNNNNNNYYYYYYMYINYNNNRRGFKGAGHTRHSPPCFQKVTDFLFLSFTAQKCLKSITKLHLYLQKAPNRKFSSLCSDSARTHTAVILLRPTLWNPDTERQV